MTEEANQGVMGQMGPCGIACAACVLGNGTVAETAKKTKEYIQGYGVEEGAPQAPGGSEVDFDDRASKMPTLFKVGLSMDAYKRGAHALLVSGEFSHPSDNKERLNAGFEYGFNKFFYLRSGYNIGYDTQGLAWGVGFKFDTSQTSGIGVDYAWEDLDYLGSAHRFTLNFSY